MPVAPIKLMAQVQEVALNDPMGRQVVDAALDTMPGLASKAQALLLRAAEREVVDYDPESSSRSVTVLERTFEAVAVTASHLIFAVAVRQERPGDEQVVSRRVQAWPRTAITDIVGPEPWVVHVETPEERTELTVNQAIAVSLLLS